MHALCEYQGEQAFLSDVESCPWQRAASGQLPGGNHACMQQVYTTYWDGCCMHMVINVDAELANNVLSSRLSK